MALKIREIAGSESGSEGLDFASRTRTYRVWDPANSDPSVAAMRTLVLLTSPATSGALTRDRLDNDYDEEGRSWTWKVGYNYKPPESALRWSFNTQGGSIRITHSLATTKFPTEAPDYKSAIGYKESADGGGEIEGVDKIIPALKLTATYRWPADAFTVASAQALSALTGTTNDGLWQGFAAGELLFLGANGEIVPGKPTEVTYEFAASPNASGLIIGDIEDIVKAGHQYLWILWEDDEDTDAKKLVKKPLAVYVEDIYPASTFTTLGIG